MLSRHILATSMRWRKNDMDVGWLIGWAFGGVSVVRSSSSMLAGYFVAI